MIINPYRFAAGGVPVITDPEEVTGVVGWFDASDNTKVLNGSLVAAADNEAVRVLDDKSTLGTIAYFEAAGEGNRPLRRAAQINGLDVLEFDGTDDVMIAAAGNNFDTYSDQTEAKTVFIVSQPTTSAAITDGSVLDLYDTATTGSRGLVTTEIAYRTVARTWVSDGTAATTCSTSAPSVITLSQSGAGNIEDVISMWLDGNSVARDSGGDGALVATSAAHRLGSLTTTYYFDGYVCEIVMYDNELSSTDRQSVENYLIDKWGI
jgi:hypothetical protein